MKLSASGALLVLLIGLGCNDTPRRPAGVPAGAEWARGVDGGVWITCAQTTKEPHAAFNCEIYHQSGSLWARGHFVHVRRANGAYVPIGAPFVQLSFDTYDGSVIHQKDETVLAPDGEVDYRFDSRNGKRVTYRLGKRVVPDVPN